MDKPKVKKEPFTIEMLEKIASSMSNPPSLAQSRLLCIYLLAFSAFLRFDEVVRIRCCDILFHTDHMIVSITSSKTDQYREGANVVVVRSGSQ